MVHHKRIAHDAVIRNNINKLRKCVEIGYEHINDYDNGHMKCTPLALACHRGYMNMVKLLVENKDKIGVDLDKGFFGPDDMLSPLGAALEVREYEIASYLVDNGANHNIVVKRLYVGIMSSAFATKHRNITIEIVKNSRPFNNRFGCVEFLTACKDHDIFRGLYDYGLHSQYSTDIMEGLDTDSCMELIKEFPDLLELKDVMETIFESHSIIYDYCLYDWILTNRRELFDLDCVNYCKIITSEQIHHKDVLKELVSNIHKLGIDMSIELEPGINVCSYIILQHYEDKPLLGISFCDFIDVFESEVEYFREDFANQIHLMMKLLRNHTMNGVLEKALEYYIDIAGADINDKCPNGITLLHVGIVTIHRNSIINRGANLLTPDMNMMTPMDYYVMHEFTGSFRRNIDQILDLLNMLDYSDLENLYRKHIGYIYSMGDIKYYNSVFERVICIDSNKRTVKKPSV